MTTIKISQQLKEFLISKSSNKTETYEQVIWRLLMSSPITEKEAKQIKSEWEDDRTKTKNNK